jgi:hypothetical protein
MFITKYSPFASTASPPEPPPTVASVAADYISTPSGVQNLMLLPARRMLKWAEYVDILSDAGKECKAIIGNLSFALFWIDLPSDIKKIAEAVRDLGKNILSGSFRKLPNSTKDLFVRSSAFLDLAGEGVKFLHERSLVVLTASELALIATFGFLGSVALTVSAASSLATQLETIYTEEIGSPKFKLALIRLVAKVCLIAVGVFGMASSVAGLAAPTLLLLILSTTLMLFSLTSYFYNKLYVEPQEKTVEAKA